MANINPMSIHTFVDVVPHLPTDVSILLRGPHGIGKSQIVRQVARVIGKQEGIDDFPVIDQRLSQKTEGDLIGLPSTDGNVTRFNPPDWYMDACLRPVCLLLDEINRATHEVMQAAFQIVLDRELNGWKLHPKTRVFAAVNASSEYTVNEMDPALLDRFWVIDLRPDTQDWLTWARGDGSIHPTISDFIAQNDKWLDPPKGAELGSINPSRRSWERLSKSLVGAGIADEPENARWYPMTIGFVGTEAAIALVDFAKSVDNRIEGKDVIENYSKVRAKVKRVTQDRLNDVIEKAATYVTKNLETLTEKQGKNLETFMADLPGELRISAWSKLTQHGLDKLALAKAVHKWCVKSVLDVFGVLPGKAGVGMVPQIPSMFQDKN